MPGDTQLPETLPQYLRPLNLHAAALHFLGRKELSAKQVVLTHRDTNKKTLRVMTYNVHSCIGMDGKIHPERIARVIAQYQPDIIALQELDAGKPRTNTDDQAHLIAKALCMQFHFHSVIHVEEEHYGNAILTHLPMQLIKTGHYPMPQKPKAGLEPRGVLWVQVKFNGQFVNVLNTHLGLTAKERKIQVETLLGVNWLASEQCKAPVILCGDFNATSQQFASRRLRAVMRDTQIEMKNHIPKSTFSGRFPAFRLDHIFVDETLHITRAQVPNTMLCKVASDHLPLLVDVKLKESII